MNKKNTSRIFGLFDYVVNIAGLNLLFLLCCLPVITMGTALTSLYAGLRAMVKREPCFHAFFSAFRKSFVRSTLVWIILLPVNVLFIVNLVFNCYYLDQGSLIALITSAVIAAVFLGVTTTVFLFHSRFEATVLRLLRYSVCLFFSYPLRAMVIAVLTWAPFALFFLFPPVFLLLGMVWLFFYFSGVSTAAIWLMNRPFMCFARDVLGMDIPGGPPTDNRV